jgi:hypothetical protein
MSSLFTRFRATLFGKKRLILALLCGVLFILCGFLWFFYSGKQGMYEGFGTDNKLSLSYRYENPTNKTSLNVYAITDTIIAGSSYGAYSPQTIAQSSKPSFVSANVIDMSATDNLWLILQPTSSTDKLPKQFDFSVRLDLSLNSGYYVNFTVPKKSAISPNKVILGDNTNIGTINLGNNSIFVKGEGEVRDVNNTLYGVVTKTVDDKIRPSYVIFDCSFSNVTVDMNSLVLQFGKLDQPRRSRQNDSSGNQGKWNKDKSGGYTRKKA